MKNSSSFIALYDVWNGNTLGLFSQLWGQHGACHATVIAMAFDAIHHSLQLCIHSVCIFIDLQSDYFFYSGST